MRPVHRRLLLKRAGVAAALASLPGAEALAASSAGDFPSHPRWRFHFISHLTTSPLFVALQYGIQDACAVFGCEYAWRGNAKGDVALLAEAVDAAVTAKADGIALTLSDARALNAPVDRALRAGIPVLSFHADAPHGGNRRLAYVGPDKRATGAMIGARIRGMVTGGQVALFVGTAERQVAKPLLEGVLSALGSARSQPVVVDAGRDLYTHLAVVEKQFLRNKALRGVFALDVGSAQAVAHALEKFENRSVKAGGYGVLPATLELIERGRLEFTVDEQPYLQGFAAVMQLFLYRLSGGLVEPSNVRTGPVFVTKANLKPYLTTRTRFEGSSSKQKYPIS